MRTVLASIIGYILICQCHSSPTNKPNNIRGSNGNNSIITEDSGNVVRPYSAHQSDNFKTRTRQDDTPAFKDSAVEHGKNVSTDLHGLENSSRTGNDTLEDKEITVIDLEGINNMSPIEFIGRQIRYLWDYMVQDKKEKEETTFIGRCIGLAKKIRQLVPIILIGGGIIITKLGFLVIFALKSLGLLGLILLLNVGTIAAKLGALLASKKAEHSPHQNLHFHVQPWKSDEHVYSSSHHSEPPYGLYDRSDAKLEDHNLYNLYEKLKLEQNLRRYLDRQ